MPSTRLSPRIRTSARISHKSAKTKPPARGGFVLVPVVGLEPTRCCHQRILSPSRLPFHHTGKVLFIYSTYTAKTQAFFAEKKNAPYRAGRSVSLAQYLRTVCTGYPSSSARPFRSVSSMAKTKPVTTPPAFSTSLAHASAVPPVARRSSTIATR